jgi:hypothetical protein
VTNDCDSAAPLVDTSVSVTRALKNTNVCAIRVLVAANIYVIGIIVGLTVKPPIG